MNKEVYLKNLQEYEKRYGAYVEIDNNKYEGKLEDCKNGCKTLKVNIDNKNIYLNSKYNPIKEAEKYYENFQKVNYGSIIFVFGFGLSYYVEELYNKVKSRAGIVVYENDLEMFDIVMKNIDITNILKNENIIIVLGKLENIQCYKINCDYILQYIPIYKDLYLEKYKEFMKHMKILIMTYRSNYYTVERFKEMWATSTFSNLKAIMNSYKIGDFENIFKDKPIIIVGAGPSLNKNVHLLKDIQDKVCIISAFSAAKALEKNGVTPHFITTIDSLQYGITDFEANIPIIFYKEINNELLKAHKSQKIISLKDDNEFLKEIIGKRYVGDSVSSGSGTVSFFSADIARFFGAKTIILIGQDFCWTKEKAHADGTVHKKTKEYEEYHGNQIEEKDIYGNTVYTNQAFKTYKLGFDEYTQWLKEIDVKMIQATEGGLAIEGAETLTLKESIDKYCKDNFYNVKDIIKEYFEKNKILVDKDKQEEAISKVKDIYEDLKKMKKLLEEATKLSERLLKNVKYSTSGLKKNNGILKRLDEIDVEIKKNEIVKSLINVYTNDIQDYIIIEEDEDEKVNFAMMNEKLYKSIDEAIGNMIKIAKEQMKYED